MLNLYGSLLLDPPVIAVASGPAQACWVVVVSLPYCGFYVFKHAGFLYY